jgi:hypothetical protein
MLSYLLVAGISMLIGYLAGVRKAKEAEANLAYLQWQLRKGIDPNGN